MNKNLRKREHLEGSGVYGKMILKYISKKQCLKLWTGLNWFCIRSKGSLLWIRWWTLGFHKSC